MIARQTNKVHPARSIAVAVSAERKVGKDIIPPKGIEIEYTARRWVFVEAAAGNGRTSQKAAAIGEPSGVLGTNGERPM